MGDVATGGEFVDFGERGKGNGLGFRNDFLWGFWGIGAGKKDVLADEPRILRRDLRTAGSLHDSRARALEDLLDGEAGCAQVGDEFGCVEAVGPLAVGGGASGVGGKCNQ